MRGGHLSQKRKYLIFPGDYLEFILLNIRGGTVIAGPAGLQPNDSCIRGGDKIRDSVCHSGKNMDYY